MLDWHARRWSRHNRFEWRSLGLFKEVEPLSSPFPAGPSRDGVEDLLAKPHPTLVIPKRRFQRPDLQLVDNDYRIRCTPKRAWRNTGKERHDCVAYQDGSSTIFSNEKIGRLELLFSVLLIDDDSDSSDSESSDPTLSSSWFRFMAIRPTEFSSRTPEQVLRRTFKVHWAAE